MELNYKRDVRMLETLGGQLQASYRVEQAWVSDLQPNQPVTVGWVRKVNHGKRPWLFFAARDLSGKWLRLTESFETLADLKRWTARLCPQCLVRLKCGRDTGLCADC